MAIHMCINGYAYIAAMDPLATALAKNLRLRLGTLTQQQFARKLGISQPTLARLEAGAQNTTLKTLSQIASALKCSACDLIR
jgi:transcriptional regulator with XRE-family HTH domain